MKGVRLSRGARFAASLSCLPRRSGFRRHQAAQVGGAVGEGRHDGAIDKPPMARKLGARQRWINRMLKSTKSWLHPSTSSRMRVRDFNGLDFMASLSRFGGLTVRPWAASFFSNRLKAWEQNRARLPEPCGLWRQEAVARLTDTGPAGLASTPARSLFVRRFSISAIDRRVSANRPSLT
jgi:hypothetical protein